MNPARLQAPMSPAGSGPLWHAGAAPGGPRIFEGIPAGTRMRRTLLVSGISAAHTGLEAALANPETRNLIRDFEMKSSRESRVKALARLKTAFQAATFQWASCDKPPIACWMYFKLRDAKEWTEPTDDFRDRQRCLLACYLVVGKLPNGSQLSTGRWSFEYSFHALGRLVSPQRSPLGMTPLQSLVLAHKTLLRASSDAVLRYRDNFLIGIGDEGALLCQATPAEVDGIETLFCVAHTWLAAEMGMSRYPHIGPATDRDDALGSFWLMPPPLRKDLGETVQVPAKAIEAFA